MVLIMIARHPSAITIMKVWKKKKKDLLLTGPGNYKAHLGPHSKVSGGKKRERGRGERERLTLSFPFINISLFH